MIKTSLMWLLCLLCVAGFLFVAIEFLKMVYFLRTQLSHAWLGELLVVSCFAGLFCIVFFVLTELLENDGDEL